MENSTNPHQTEEGGEGREGVDLRHEDVPGGGKRIGSGANAPNDAGFAKEVLDQSFAKLERMEGHRSSHALGLVDLGIVPEAVEKVETFFFRID